MNKENNELVRITNNMFENEKAVYNLINNEHNEGLKYNMFRYQIKRYDEITFIHGSGKDLIGSENYKNFMNDKWCLLFHDVLLLKRLKSYNGDYR